MALVEPAVAHMACPVCTEPIDVLVPVEVSITTDERGPVMVAQVIDSQWQAQEIWDHMLAAHGPAL